MSSNPRSHATRGRFQDEEPILHEVLVGGAFAADPEKTRAPWGPNTIRWTLAEGFSWGSESPGIDIRDNWPFDQPTLNTDNTYSVTYSHQSPVATFFHYSVNVVRNDGFETTGGNDPVIENQGGGGGGGGEDE